MSMVLGCLLGLDWLGMVARVLEVEERMVEKEEPVLYGI